MIAKLTLAVLQTTKSRRRRSVSCKACLYQHLHSMTIVPGLVAVAVAVVLDRMNEWINKLCSINDIQEVM